MSVHEKRVANFFYETPDSEDDGYGFEYASSGDEHDPNIGFSKSRVYRTLAMRIKCKDTELDNMVLAFPVDLMPQVVTDYVDSEDERFHEEPDLFLDTFVEDNTTQVNLEMAPFSKRLMHDDYFTNDYLMRHPSGMNVDKLGHWKKSMEQMQSFNLNMKSDESLSLEELKVQFEGLNTMQARFHSHMTIDKWIKASTLSVTSKHLGFEYIADLFSNRALHQLCTDCQWHPEYMTFPTTDIPDRFSLDDARHRRWHISGEISEIYRVCFVFKGFPQSKNWLQNYLQLINSGSYNHDLTGCLLFHCSYGINMIEGPEDLIEEYLSQMDDESLPSFTMSPIKILFQMPFTERFFKKYQVLRIREMPTYEDPKFASANKSCGRTWRFLSKVILNLHRLWRDLVLKEYSERSLDKEELTPCSDLAGGDYIMFDLNPSEQHLDDMYSHRSTELIGSRHSSRSGLHSKIIAEDDDEEEEKDEYLPSFLEKYLPSEEVLELIIHSKYTRDIYQHRKLAAEAIEHHGIFDEVWPPASDLVPEGLLSASREEDELGSRPVELLEDILPPHLHYSKQSWWLPCRQLTAHLAKITCPLRSTVEEESVMSRLAGQAAAAGRLAPTLDVLVPAPKIIPEI